MDILRVLVALLHQQEVLHEFLNYRPLVRKRTDNGLLKNFRNKKDCFDNQVLSSQRFINALKCISQEELAPTLRQRRQLRISALRFIKAISIVVSA